MDHTATIIEAFAGPHAAATGGKLTMIWKKVAGWKRKQNAIAQLHALSDRSLADIGIDRSEIESVVWHGKIDPTRFHR